jgi:hypothetical protein
MLNAGWDYSAAMPPVDHSGLVDASTLFGATDAVVAAEAGYSGQVSSPISLSGAALSTVGAPVDSEMHAKWISALLGEARDVVITSPLIGSIVAKVRAPGGCRGEGLAAVLGSGETVEAYLVAMATLQDGIAAAHFETTGSVDFIALTSEWASCMAAAGCPDARDPCTFGGRQWSEPQGSQVEMLAAGQDAECRVRTNVVDVALGIEVGILNAAVDRYAPALDSLGRALGGATGESVEATRLSLQG